MSINPHSKSVGPQHNKTLITVYENICLGMRGCRRQEEVIVYLIRGYRYSSNVPF